MTERHLFGMLDHQVADLVALCIRFIKKNHITCGEVIYQSDHVIENAYEFIEEICELVGYANHEKSS